jgi:hypothetical protein
MSMFATSCKVWKETKKRRKGGDGDEVHLIHEEREREKMVEEVVIFLGDFQSPKT